MSKTFFILYVIIGALTVTSCTTEQAQIQVVLPNNISELIHADFLNQTVEKTMQVLDTESHQSIHLNDSIIQSEFKFLHAHFNISDKLLEGKWKKNTFIKSETSITEEYLGNSSNPFRSVLVKKKKANIQTIEIHSVVTSLIGTTTYKLKWENAKRLIYSIQKSDQYTIQFAYCLKNQCNSI